MNIGEGLATFDNLRAAVGDEHDLWSREAVDLRRGRVAVRTLVKQAEQVAGAELGKRQLLGDGVRETRLANEVGRWHARSGRGPIDNEYRVRHLKHAPDNELHRRGVDVDVARRGSSPASRLLDLAHLGEKHDRIPHHVAPALELHERLAIAIERGLDSAEHRVSERGCARELMPRMPRASPAARR